MTDPTRAEGELINPYDVRPGDRVRLVLNDGDEATITVRSVCVNCLFSKENAYRFAIIRAVYYVEK